MKWDKISNQGATAGFRKDWMTQQVDMEGVRNQASQAAGQAALNSGAPRIPVNLNGAYNFKVDAKGRVSLPAKFRKVLSPNLVIAQELKGKCLYVFENADYEAWINELFDKRFGGFDETNELHLGLMLRLKSMAKDVEVDKSGRIMLPSEAREAADIDKDVVIVGSKGRFEIWGAKRYNDSIAAIDLSIFYDKSK